MKRKNLIWALVFALAALGSLALYTLRPATGTEATVWLDGELYTSIDLSAVALPYELEIESDWGTNRLLVSPGAIEVCWSDCPEQVCVAQGAISSPYIPITCLPHRLVIQIEEG